MKVVNEMSELFAEIPQIGKLFYHHIYLFYDGPQIFSCLTPAFQPYFLVAIPSEQGEAWLCAPMSPGKLAGLEKNTVEIRCALTQPESILWRIEATETEWSATLVEPSSLTEEMLPEKGEYLDFPDNTELVAPSESPLVQAKQEMRDIIEISFEKDNTHMSEISCIALGELLNNTQQLIYAIAYKDGGLRGPIPKKIREDCTLCVSSMFAASVGVRLKSDEYCDLQFETPLTNTLHDFNQLFDVANDKTQLKSFLLTQSPRVATKYRALIRSLLAHNTGLRINNASSDESIFARHFTTKELAENLGLIDSEIEELVEHSTLYGTLVGVNVERNTFEFISVDKEKIKGSIAASLCDNTFSVPQSVEIQVEIRVGVDSVTRDEKLIYQLIGMSPIINEN